MHPRNRSLCIIPNTITVHKCISLTVTAPLLHHPIPPPQPLKTQETVESNILDAEVAFSKLVSHQILFVVQMLYTNYSPTLTTFFTQEDSTSSSQNTRLYYHQNTPLGPTFFALYQIQSLHMRISTNNHLSPTPQHHPPRTQGHCYH